ncbi:hypothetical protein E4Q23_13835 [Candidatus Accumulibacter phosphatis]|uniref:Uncharacterized protein n=1 Tax=Candidatus Accumulibacter phosphatis TaxID=327160 RepID=A0ABX1TX15_9PROT|nr:hypothetical protein [Candidatus Accumulibacter phosphatis]NMQ28740.1 hypothetical protein [Candidatus Accumulibacter phosphatis]
MQGISHDPTTAGLRHCEEAQPTRQSRGLAFHVFSVHDVNGAMRREIVRGWNWIAASAAPPRNDVGGWCGAAFTSDHSPLTIRHSRQAGFAINAKLAPATHETPFSLAGEGSGKEGGTVIALIARGASIVITVNIRLSTTLAVGDDAAFFTKESKRWSRTTDGATTVSVHFFVIRPSIPPPQRPSCAIGWQRCAITGPRILRYRPCLSSATKKQMSQAAAGHESPFSPGRERQRLQFITQRLKRKSS